MLVDSLRRLSSLSSSQGFQRASIIRPILMRILYLSASSSLSGGRYIFPLRITMLPSEGITMLLLFVSVLRAKLLTPLGDQLS